MPSNNFNNFNNSNNYNNNNNNIINIIDNILTTERNLKIINSEIKLLNKEIEINQQIINRMNYYLNNIDLFTNEDLNNIINNNIIEEEEYICSTYYRYSINNLILIDEQNPEESICTCILGKCCFIKECGLINCIRNSQSDLTELYGMCYCERCNLYELPLKCNSQGCNKCNT